MKQQPTRQIPGIDLTFIDVPVGRIWGTSGIDDLRGSSFEKARTYLQEKARIEGSFDWTIEIELDGIISAAFRSLSDFLIALNELVLEAPDRRSIAIDWRVADGDDTMYNIAEDIKRHIEEKGAVGLSIDIRRDDVDEIRLLIDRIIVALADGAAGKSPSREQLSAVYLKIGSEPPPLDMSPDSAATYGALFGFDRSLQESLVRGNILPPQLITMRRIKRISSVLEALGLFDDGPKIDQSVSSWAQFLSFALKKIHAGAGPESARTHAHLESEQLSPPSADVIPRAERRALQFDGNTDGPIDLSPATRPGEHLQHNEGCAEDYAELRAKASALRTLGSNRLGKTKLPLDRFLSMPEEIHEVRAKLFWSRVNTLRILLEDHKHAISEYSAASEPDERRLEPSTASQLRDLVETINVFVVGDPVLMDLDSARPGPQDLSTGDAEVALAEPIVKGVLNSPEIASTLARDALGEQYENARITDDSLAGVQTREFARHSLRNLVAELLRRAYGSVRAVSRAAKSETGSAWRGMREGAYRASGAALLGGVTSELLGMSHFSSSFVHFVVRNAEELTAYITKAFQNPALAEIVSWIVRLGG